MGSLTYSWREQDRYSAGVGVATWTVTFTVPNIVASGDTFTVKSTAVCKYVGSSRVAGMAWITYAHVVGDYGWFEYYKGKSGSVHDTVSMRSGTNYSMTVTPTERTMNTSDFFSSSNPTTRTINLPLVIPQYAIMSQTAQSGGYYASDIDNIPTADTTVGNIATLTLDAPPTFTHSAVTYNTPYIYAGLTTASVTVSDLSAKYGGNITDITLTIANQSRSRSTEGALSVPLDTIGTFTPTITVTDSRGQTTTEALDPITVNGYVAPSVSFTADRTLQSGVSDDEGTYATVNATFVYTDVVAQLVEPSVVLTDENGTQTTPVVTWYTTRATDGTLSNVLSDWTTVAYGDTVYGLIPNVSTQYSYQISIRPRDTEGTGTAIYQTIAPAFYTIDFLAGGHGIAFGQPASTVGFECNMDALFHGVLAVDLDTTASSGTDKEIYDALVSLGWDSDVIV